MHWLQWLWSKRILIENHILQVTIPEAGLSTEVNACLFENLIRSDHHSCLQELKSSSFWPVVETAIQVASITIAGLPHETTMRYETQSLLVLCQPRLVSS